MSLAPFLINLNTQYHRFKSNIYSHRGKESLSIGVEIIFLDRSGKRRRELIGIMKFQKKNKVHDEHVLRTHGPRKMALHELGGSYRCRAKYHMLNESFFLLGQLIET